MSLITSTQQARMPVPIRSPGAWDEWTPQDKSSQHRVLGVDLFAKARGNCQAFFLEFQDVDDVENEQHTMTVVIELVVAGGKISSLAVTPSLLNQGWAMPFRPRSGLMATPLEETTLALRWRKPRQSKWFTWRTPGRNVGALKLGDDKRLLPR
jgi:hypothetical protein